MSLFGAKENEFISDARAVAGQRASRLVTAQILVISALVATGIVWAASATIDEVTSGLGRVIPSRQLQVVQMPDAGIVVEVFVREGERVDVAQPLMRIDDTTAASRLGEMTTRQDALLAELARVEAEASAAEVATFDRELEVRVPALVRLQQQTFAARRAKIGSEIATFRQQLMQREQERDELAIRSAKLKNTLALLKRELELNRRLAGRGAVPEIEIIRLERQHAEMQGDFDLVMASIPRAETGMEEVRARMIASQAAVVSEAHDRLTQLRSDLAVIEQSIKAAQERVTRTILRSPVRGIVNKLHVTTIGAVAQTGQAVAEVVPLDDSLLVETRVRPKDVAFLHPTQSASVKLTAYDYLKYGALEGTVERISADTITDPDGQTYYHVIVRTEQNYIGAENERLLIMPGMVAQVDIRSGQKTVLDYILKPVSRIRHEALRER